MSEENRRRGGMSEAEIKLFATEIAQQLASHNVCSFTPEEQAGLKSLLKTKKWAAGVTLLGIGTFLLWVLKDVYDWFKAMIHWGNG